MHAEIVAARPYYQRRKIRDSALRDGMVEIDSFCQNETKDFLRTSGAKN